jgi:hypothetical protein
MGGVRIWRIFGNGHHIRPQRGTLARDAVRDRNAFVRFVGTFPSLQHVA